ncbi:MAG: hypothetical protein Q9210_002384 [Variospora velana]
MPPAGSASILAVACFAAATIAASHGQGHGARRRFNQGTSVITQNLPGQASKEPVLF